MSKSNGSTLLDKAKAAKHSLIGRPVDLDYAERVELALAYARLEVSSSQCAEAMGVKASNASQMLGTTLMQAIRRGELKVERVAGTPQD